MESTPRRNRTYLLYRQQLTNDGGATRVGGTIPFVCYEAVGGGANFQNYESERIPKESSRVGQN